MDFLMVIVLYVVIWALVFLMVNPLWQTSQSEGGEVVPGTPESAPVDAMVRKKAIITTVIGTLVFALIYGALEYQWLTVDMFKFFKFPSER
jgi:predicted secreted protein